MSCHLVWRAVTPRPGAMLPDALKVALRKKYGSSTYCAILKYDDTPYLEGLRDAGVDGAGTLIEAVATYGEVEVTEER